eukprot:scaffold20949_cov36-Prasinocladus_malaysianus.AAC.1
MDCNILVEPDSNTAFCMGTVRVFFVRIHQNGHLGMGVWTPCLACLRTTALNVSFDDISTLSHQWWQCMTLQKALHVPDLGKI